MSSRLAWTREDPFTLASAGDRFIIRTEREGAAWLTDRSSRRERECGSIAAAKRLANGLLDANERL